MYANYWLDKKQILLQMDCSAYCYLDMNPLISMYLKAMMEGKWCLEDTTRDRAGYISLASYCAIAKDVRTTMIENIEHT